MLDSAPNCELDTKEYDHASVELCLFSLSVFCLLAPHFLDQISYSCPHIPFTRIRTMAVTHKASITRFTGFALAQRLASLVKPLADCIGGVAPVLQRINWAAAAKTRQKSKALLSYIKRREDDIWGCRATILVISKRILLDEAMRQQMAKKARSDCFSIYGNFGEEKKAAKIHTHTLHE